MALYQQGPIDLALLRRFLERGGDDVILHLVRDLVDISFDWNERQQQNILAIASVNQSVRNFLLQRRVMALLLEEVKDDWKRKRFTDPSLSYLSSMAGTHSANMMSLIRMLYISDIGGALISRGDDTYHSQLTVRLILVALTRAGIDVVTGRQRLQELCISPLSHVDVVSEFLMRPKLLSVHKALKKLSLDVSVRIYGGLDHLDMPDVSAMASSLPNVECLQLVGAGAGDTELWALRLLARMPNVRSYCLHVLAVITASVDWTEMQNDEETRWSSQDADFLGPHDVDVADRTFAGICRQYREAWEGVGRLEKLVGFTISNPTIVDRGAMLWDALKDKNLFRLGILHPQVRYSWIDPNVHGNNAPSVGHLFARWIRRWEGAPRLEYLEWGALWEETECLLEATEPSHIELSNADEIYPEDRPIRQKLISLKGVHLDFLPGWGPTTDSTGLGFGITDGDEENIFDALGCAQELSIGYAPRNGNGFSWIHQDDRLPVNKMELEGPCLDWEVARAAVSVMPRLKGLSIAVDYVPEGWLEAILEEAEQLEMLHMRGRYLDMGKTTYQGIWDQPNIPNLQLGEGTRRWWIDQLPQKLEAFNDDRVYRPPLRRIFIGSGNWLYAFVRDPTALWIPIDCRKVDDEAPWLFTRNWQDMLWPPLRSPFGQTMGYEARSKEVDDEHKKKRYEAALEEMLKNNKGPEWEKASKMKPNPNAIIDAARKRCKEEASRQREETERLKRQKLLDLMSRQAGG